MMRIEKIRIETGLKLGDIMRDVERGKLRIPRFQREFVWERPKVIKLLDSIYHQFPVGSFFFWAAPRKYNKFFRNIAELSLPKPEEMEDITFILDGQQRITSLYATIKNLTLEGVDYGKICFDLENEEFTARTSDDRRYIAIHDLFNENRYYTIYDELSQEYKKKLANCKYIFENYPPSVILVREFELEDVCDIFERINQSGKRLSLTDLVVANTWSEDFDLREKIKDYNRTLIVKGFQELDMDAISEALSLNIRGACTRSVQLQLRTDEMKAVWDETIDAVSLVIDFLRGNLGVKTSAFLPYRGIVPVLAYYFYKSGNRTVGLNHKKFIEKLFWRVSFSERYSSSAPTNMGEDKKILDRIINNDYPSVDYPVNLGVETIQDLQIYTNSALKNSVLCLFATKQPKHFKNNNNLQLDDSYFSDFNSPEKHHIFPASYLQKMNIWDSSLANFCFIPAELNKDILNKKPSQYFKEIKDENPEFETTMKTHLIPVDKDSGIWSDEYNKFLKQRAELIKREIELLI
jgi:hypothetical protein